MLDASFHYIGGRLYEGMDRKPYLMNDAQYLDLDQVKQERSAKAAIFASVKDVREKSCLFFSSFFYMASPEILLRVFRIDKAIILHLFVPMQECDPLRAGGVSESSSSPSTHFSSSPFSYDQTGSTIHYSHGTFICLAL